MAVTEAPQTTNAAAPPASGVNGSKAGGVLVPPEIGERRAKALATRSAARAETLAMLESGADETAGESDAKPAIEKKPDATPDTADEVGTDAGEADEVDADETPATKVAPKKSEDPAVSGALAKVQAAEKKARESLSKDRAAFEKERTAHADELKELRALKAEYEALKKSAPTDVVGTFKRLGIDLEHGAKSAWAHHQAEKDPTNPQHRAVAERLQRDRQQDDELTLTKKELAALRERIDQREASEKSEREAAQYFQGMGRAIDASTETPLLKTALTKNPQGTWKKLANIAFELHQEHGELPDAADVIATYEKRRLEELEELGVAPPTAATTTTSATPKKNHTPADKKQPAKTLGTDLSTPIVVKPRSAKSEREHRAETLDMLESGKLE